MMTTATAPRSRPRRRFVPGAFWLSMISVCASIGTLVTTPRSPESLALLVCAIVSISLAIAVQEIVTAILEGQAK